MDNIHNQEVKQRTGVVTRFVAHRNFGFIVSREDSGAMQTYFFHLSNVRFCEPEIPRLGDSAAFDVFLLPAKPGKYPLADNVSIYKKPEPIVPNALAGASALAGKSGEPSSQNGDTVGAQ
jgi:hypothetical protein